MFPSPLPDLAAELIARADALGLTVATAESCTAGLIAGCIATIPGASRVLDAGFIVYSDAAKIALGVDPALIVRDGAVSASVAGALACAALARSRADLAVAVTGLAGPGGATATKPIGRVEFALSDRRVGRVDDPWLLRRDFALGDRSMIHCATIEQALNMLLQCVDPARMIDSTQSTTQPPKVRQR